MAFYDSYALMITCKVIVNISENLQVTFSALCDSETSLNRGNSLDAVVAKWALDVFKSS